MPHGPAAVAGVAAGLRAGPRLGRAELAADELQVAALVDGHEALADGPGGQAVALQPLGIAVAEQEHRRQAVGGRLRGVLDVAGIGIVAILQNVGPDALGQPLDARDGRLARAAPARRRGPAAKDLDVITPATAQLAVGRLPLGEPPVQDGLVAGGGLLKTTSPFRAV